MFYEQLAFLGFFGPQIKSSEIRDEDVKHFKPLNHPMANSLAFIGHLVKEENSPKIVWEGLSGPNALNLIGRFGHLDPEIEKQCLELAKQEEKHYPEKVVAEIVHVPEGRMGNILTRPHYRKYEIPYLAQSHVPFDNQIPVSDLLISVKNNHLKLRSKRLNNEVIPRMANAHNFSLLGLPVYHFLCDLQYQNLRPVLSWSWSFLGNEPFLPRVTYKNIIFSPALWNIRTDLLRPLLKLKDGELHRQFQKIKDQLELPDRVLYKEGDNELLLDLSLPVCVDILLTYVKKNHYLKLTEYLFQCKNIIVKNSEGQGYVNEIVVPFIKQLPAEVKQHSRSASLVSGNNVKQSFEPFSNWVYYKIYCGPKTADNLLSSSIPAACKQLARRDVIDKWFFIRFADPKNHLRLRFHLREPKEFNLLNAVLERSFSQYTASKVIWKMEADTYQRELSRYGEDTIEVAEDFFHVNSRCVASLLRLFKKDEIEGQRFIIGLWGVHKMYDAFDFPIEKRIKLVEISEDAFAKEFGLTNNKQARRKVNDDYRWISKDIQFFIDGKLDGSGLTHFKEI